MKDWNKLTVEELAALTDAEVETYKKLLYAQNGIEFPEEPKEIDDTYIPCDMTVYYVQNIGSSWGGICFSSLEEAKHVADVVRECKSLGHISHKDGGNIFEPGTETEWNGKRKDFSITTDEAYSKKRFSEVQETLSTYAKLREQYDKDKKAYDSLYSKAIEVTEEFMERLNNARERIKKRKRLAEKYWLDYMPLAENNSEIAMNFLKKAYIVNEEDEAYVKNHEKDYTECQSQE